MNHRTRLVLLLVITALLGSGACSARRATVTVLASWTGDEEVRFRAVLDAFEHRTGIHYDYAGSRAVDQVLASQVQQGNPPDIAVLPNPGSAAAYVRSRKLTPLDGVLSPEVRAGYGPAWTVLQRIGTDSQYAVAVKTDLKSMIWYAPKKMAEPFPQTRQQLLDLSARLTAAGRTPWCLGMGAPPASGWPGTDWIEDILLHASGPDFYRRWSGGKVAWTTPEVRDAWQTWGTLVTGQGAVRGGSRAALLTDFGDAGEGLFTDPPGCLLEHQASFALSRYRAERSSTRSVAGQDFDYFPFPPRGVSEVSADLAVMFDDTPESRALIDFLAGDEAQLIQAGTGDNVFSPRRSLADQHTDVVSRGIARTLTAESLCFDASDLMPAPMTEAFYRAVLEFLDDPARLDALLHELDGIRLAIPADQWLDIPCGQ
ncbi:ABC transporter substrate-binding protein [Actinokineospora enzanensis]|uniref:ABC transporter substrate-binding protein n=1 Tax=Actinokineospora enzanensis TaxID=155975 RepID=UPI00036AC4F8|nr:ABC transporter substrate-binding protein [Actinokineospora enzanensis]